VFGEQRDVAFVLAAGVVDQDHHSAALQVVQDLGDGSDRHRSSSGQRAMLSHGR
jgi:hypothetical protein